MKISLPCFHHTRRVNQKMSRPGKRTRTTSFGAFRYTIRTSKVAGTPRVPSLILDRLFFALCLLPSAFSQGVSDGSRTHTIRFTAGRAETATPQTP
jgi:hypothetical protein